MSKEVKNEKAPKSATTGEVKTDKPEKASKKRVPHPLIGAKTGYPFTVVPTDYDPKLHKPLKKKDFSDENVGKANYVRYLAGRVEVQANKMIAKVKDLRTSADRIEKFGDDSVVKKQKKLDKLKASIAALEAELAGN